MLLFDRETDSLWSQLLSQAVTGPLAGTHLATLPADNTTWGAWVGAHPDTQVLSSATGYQRSYNEDPYGNLLFSRAPALLVLARGQAKVYPFSELKKARSSVVDELGGIRITVVFDQRTKTARATGEGPGAVTFFASYLNDLKAFYPEAEIYRARRR